MLPPCARTNRHTFEPVDRSNAPRGGPSRALRAAVGYGEQDTPVKPEVISGFLGDGRAVPNAALEELMEGLFDQFVPLEAMQAIVEATNNKARELVVKAKSSFRLAEPGDPRGDLTNCSAGPHARYRAPELLAHPLSLDELRVFLGIRIVMGGYWSERIDDYWSSTDMMDRCPIIADSMRLDRFKLILATLSFLRPEYSGNPKFGGTSDKLFKLREVNDILNLACKSAWDVEPDFVVDESRCRLSSRYCTFTTQM